MLKKQVIETIKKYNLIEEGDRIVLGVSGGPDSISMLTVLDDICKTEFTFHMTVAHVNHGLRENAKIDEEYVKSFCDKIGVECFVLHSNVKEIAEKEKMRFRRNWKRCEI